MINIKKAIEQFKLNVLKIEEVSDSYSSTVKILLLENGERVVIKIPFNKEKIEREVRVLELLSENSLTPNLLNVWYGDKDNVGALLMSYIEGNPIQLPADDSIIFEIGKSLATIHNIKLEKYELDNIKNDWWENIRIKLKQWITEIEGSIPLDLMKKIENYYNKNLILNFSSDGPCLVHLDFRLGNLLVNKGKLVGVIDFETSRSGSACIDFTKIAESLWKEHPNTKQVFIDGYESIRKLPDIEKTLPIYTIYNAIGGIVWCVRRDKLDDNFFNENLKVLTERLANY